MQRLALYVVVSLAVLAIGVGVFLSERQSSANSSRPKLATPTQVTTPYPIVGYGSVTDRDLALLRRLTIAHMFKTHRPVCVSHSWKRDGVVTIDVKCRRAIDRP